MPTLHPDLTETIDLASAPVVILCGDMATHIRQAGEKLPKPLVDIGGRPILWRIMKTYGHYGFRLFVLALGYKSEQIKSYFLDYREHFSDVTLHLSADHSPEDDGLLLEKGPLRGLAMDTQLTRFPHEGFWMGMDTCRDWTELNSQWDVGKAPWKV